jgi:hypothetical protein
MSLRILPVLSQMQVRSTTLTTCSLLFSRTMAQTAQHDPGSPWDPAYPIAKNQNPTKIFRETVLGMLRGGQQLGKDVVLVDLRREDLIASSTTVKHSCFSITDLVCKGRYNSRRSEHSCSEPLSKHSDLVHTFLKGWRQVGHLVLRYCITGL